MPTTRQKYQRFIRCGSAKPVVLPTQDLVGQLSLLQPFALPAHNSRPGWPSFHDQSGGKRAITLSRKDWRFGPNRASLSRHVEGRWPFSACPAGLSPLRGFGGDGARRRPRVHVVFGPPWHPAAGTRSGSGFRASTDRVRAPSRSISDGILECAAEVPRPAPWAKPLWQSPDHSLPPSGGSNEQIFGLNGQVLSAPIRYRCSPLGSSLRCRCSLQRTSTRARAAAAAAARPVGCWAPSQEKLAIEQTSGRQRINIHDAIDLETGQTRMIEALTIDAASTIRLLQSIEALYPMLALIHVFLDNARYHHAKLVQEWLALPGRRIKLHFIPTYCPHLNPIERLWGLMHRNVTHNKCYATCAQFADATLSFLREKVPGNWADLCDSVTDNFRVINPKDFRVMT